MTFKIRHTYRTLFKDCIGQINDETIKKNFQYYIGEKYIKLEKDIIINYDEQISFLESYRSDFIIRLIINLYHFINNKYISSLSYNNKIFRFEGNFEQFPLVNHNLLIEFRSFSKFLSYEIFKDKDHKVTLNDIKKLI